MAAFVLESAHGWCWLRCDGWTVAVAASRLDQCSSYILAHNQAKSSTNSSNADVSSPPTRPTKFPAAKAGPHVVTLTEAISVPPLQSLAPGRAAAGSILLLIAIGQGHHRSTSSRWTGYILGYRHHPSLTLPRHILRELDAAASPTSSLSLITVRSALSDRRGYCC